MYVACSVTRPTLGFVDFDWSESTIATCSLCFMKDKYPQGSSTICGVLPYC